MFTGIIKGQSKAKIISINDTDMVIDVDLSVLDIKPKIGDSIAINGVCLTITTLKDNKARFDLMHETLSRTNFREVNNGDFLNLEPSMTLNDKLDGHVVYGDVDAVGKIESIKEIGNSKVYTFSYPKEFSKYMINKGRITIDGASLTVIDSEKNGIFSVSFIPHSLEKLNISNKNKGDTVNLEFDVYAKLVYKQRKFND